MAETQHTPGPWDYDGPPHNIIVWSSPEDRICFMTSDGPTETNARLIAAAPDLLEASKKAVEFIEEFYPNAAFNGHTASLRHAISKAEGKSHG